MAKPTPDVPPRVLALYEKIVATNPEVQRKGAANPYTSRNGHMFSFLMKEGKMALRLPAEAREAFVKKYRTKPCISHNTVMKEYVVVPASLLAKTRDLKVYFDASWDYIGTLKPKPTTRKKKAVTKKKTSVRKKTASKKKAVAKKKTSKKKASTRKKAAVRKRAR